MEYIFLNALFGTDSRPDRHEQKPLTVKSNSGKPSSIAYGEYDSEVKALEKEYGFLSAGTTITTTLTDILNIIPKKRKRIDSYKGLISYLSGRGVTLNIKSRKTK